MPTTLRMAGLSAKGKAMSDFQAACVVVVVLGVLAFQAFVYWLDQKEKSDEQ